MSRPDVDTLAIRRRLTQARGNRNAEELARRYPQDVADLLRLVDYLDATQEASDD